MAAETERASVVATLQGNLAQELGRLRTTFSELNNALELTKKAFSVLSTVVSLPVTQFSAIVAKTKELVATYDKVFLSNLRLETTLRLTGSSAGKQRAELDKLNESLEEKTRVEKEAIESGQSLAVLAGFQGEQLKKLTVAAVDLAEFLGTDVESGFLKVIQAAETGAITIGRTRVELSTLADPAARTAEVLERLGDSFEGFAEKAAAGGLGPIKQAERAFEDLEEAIGGALADSPEIVAFFRTIAEGLRELAAFIETNRQQFGDLFGKLFLASLQIATKAVAVFVKVVVAAFNTALTIIDKLSQSSLGKALGFKSPVSPLRDDLEAANKVADDLRGRLELLNIVRDQFNRKGLEVPRDLQIQAQSLEEGLERAEAQAASIRAQVFGVGDLGQTLDAAKRDFDSLVEKFRAGAPILSGEETFVAAYDRNLKNLEKLAREKKKLEDLGPDQRRLELLQQQTQELIAQALERTSGKSTAEIELAALEKQLEAQEDATERAKEAFTIALNTREELLERASLEAQTAELLEQQLQAERDLAAASRNLLEVDKARRDTADEIAKKKDEEAKAQNAAAEKVIADLREQQEVLRNTLEVNKQRDETGRLGLAGRGELDDAALKRFAEAADAAKVKLDELLAGADPETVAEFQAQLESLRAPLETPDEGNFFAGFVSGARQATESVSDLGKAGAEAGEQLTNALVDGLVDVFVRARGSLKEFAADFLQTVAVILTKLILLATFRAALGGDGGIGDIVAGFITGKRGGRVPRFDGGGPVPGIDHGRDEVVGLLRPEEYVLRPEATRYYGMQAAEAFNQMLLPKGLFSGTRMPAVTSVQSHRFAQGGPVGGASSRREFTSPMVGFIPANEQTAERFFRGGEPGLLRVVSQSRSAWNATLRQNTG